MATTHTPYDGSAEPFTIGLQQLDLNDWIEIDESFLAYLAEKSVSLSCMRRRFSLKSRIRRQHREKCSICSRSI